MQAPLPAPPAQPAACVGSVRGLFWRASQRTGICIPALPPANGRLPCKRKHAIIARFLFAARFARYARYLKQKLFRGTPPPGRAGGFHNSPPPPLKNNRLGRFAFPGDLLYISAFCRAHTARHGAYTVFEGKAGYLCRTRRGGKFFRAKTGCQSCPVQRAPPNTDRSLLRGRAALAAIKHSAASYRPRGRPP